jgi:predicted nucleic acid-binding protein
MPVLVDTSVWSLALRRKPKHLNSTQAAIVIDLQQLLRDGQTRLVGAIRQELLTGIRDPGQYEWLRDYLRAIPDTDLAERDYEDAAAAANRCIAAGIAVNNVDLLICAVAMRRGWEIYTTDDDYQYYTNRLPIRLRPLAIS